MEEIIQMLEEAFGDKDWKELLNFYLSKGFEYISYPYAFVLYKILKDSIKIEYIVVKRELRGQGIGTKLLNTICDLAVFLNKKFIFVDTHDFRAIHFYEMNGFIKVFKVKLPDEPESYILAKFVGEGNEIDVEREFWNWANLVYNKDEIKDIELFNL